jgi:KaiC/GvpD/RAD55 family RecA-like ATPase
MKKSEAEEKKVPEKPLKEKGKPDHDKKWFTADEVLQLKFEGSAWLWDNYIPKGEISCITGPSDTGKSTLLRQLALAIASGATEFLGKELHTVTGNVIYVSTEDGGIWMQQSLQKQIAGLGINKECRDKVHFVFDEENIFHELEQKLKKQPVDLIVIDAMSDIFEGNPNDYVAVRKFTRKLKRLTRLYNCSVILLHHNIKNSEKSAPDKNKMNGSQGLEAKGRSLFELRLDDDNVNQRKLTILKGNYVPQSLKKKSVLIKFDGEHALFSDTGKTFEHTTSVGNSKKKFDPSIWIPRMEKWKEKGHSYQIGREELVKEFPDEDVPSETWFKENPKSDKYTVTATTDASVEPKIELVTTKKQDDATK